MSSYADSISTLESLYHLPILPSSRAGLDRARRLLQEVGDPQFAFRSLHVAGSCGKGSTTTMISSCLRAAPRSVGLFLSPHLAEYTERISVDGQEISQGEWARHWETLRPVVEAMCAGTLPQYDLGRPALFEVLFALACLHFRARDVQWAAIETGLGGRLDATNTLQPDVAVLTNVSLEHTRVLGNTVEQIAREKAAIMKPGAAAVLGTEDPRVVAVVDERVTVTGSPLLRVGVDVRVEVSDVTLRSQVVTLHGPDGVVSAPLSSGAPFQAVNAATAYLAIVALRRRGVEIGNDDIVSGLQSTRVPGRFEVVGDDPLVLLDGAHNPEEIGALAAALGDIPNQPFTVLFAAMGDKDTMSMARSLAPVAGRVVVTQAPGTERAANPDDLAQCFKQIGVSVQVEQDAERALVNALQTAGRHPLLVTGSLYLVGWARSRLRERQEAW